LVGSGFTEVSGPFPMASGVVSPTYHDAMSRSRRDPIPENPRTGVGVDAYGFPVKDPTANVLDLVQAAIQRQDDMRTLATEHERYVAELRAHYDELLRTAETARIDAIRAVDVSAVQRAAEVALNQASTLASQVAASAETLRAQVAAAATASSVSLAAALVPIQEAIADLRRSQYEQAGQRTQVVEQRATTGETRLNIGAIAGIVGGVVGLLFLLIALYTAFGK
jgi:hypothetical protein